MLAKLEIFSSIVIIFFVAISAYHYRHDDKSHGTITSYHHSSRRNGRGGYKNTNINRVSQPKVKKFKQQPPQIFVYNFTSKSPPRPSPSRCSVYLPFDNDLNNHATPTFPTVPQGTAPTVDNAVSARGTGSALLRSGALQIERTSAILDDASSWCLFFKCGNNACRNNAPFPLLQNFNPASFTYSVAMGGMYTTGPPAAIVYGVSLYPPIVPIAYTNQKQNVNTFTQLCATYDVTTGMSSFYVDNDLVDRQVSIGGLQRPVVAYVVGDQNGDFVGNIDEVLICNRVLTQTEVSAHFSGQTAMRLAGLIP